MRERLIKIVKDSLVKNIDYTHRLAENITDDLLANGVIVPPCKVGDTVYIIDDVEFEEPYVLDVVVTAIGYDINGFWITMSLPLGMKQSAHVGECSFGKTVFLTREEAEAKMKGGEQG